MNEPNSRRIVRSELPTEMRAPTWAPGTTPIISGRANRQAMWPSAVWVISAGIENMATATRLDPMASLIGMRSTPVNAGIITMPPPDAEQPGQQSRSRAHQRQHPHARHPAEIPGDVPSRGWSGTVGVGCGVGDGLGLVALGAGRRQEVGLDGGDVGRCG